MQREGMKYKRELKGKRLKDGERRGKEVEDGNS